MLLFYLWQGIGQSKSNIDKNIPKPQTLPGKMRELSVVITVLNEHDNIVPLIGALQNALNEIDYEVIFVEEGSNGGTQKQMREHADDWIKLIELRKNYGQSTAMTARIEHSEGIYISLSDG